MGFEDLMFDHGYGAEDHEQFIQDLMALADKETRDMDDELDYDDTLFIEDDALSFEEEEVLSPFLGNKSDRTFSEMSKNQIMPEFTSGKNIPSSHSATDNVEYERSEKKRWEVKHTLTKGTSKWEVLTPNKELIECDIQIPFDDGNILIIVWHEYQFFEQTSFKPGKTPEDPATLYIHYGLGRTDCRRVKKLVYRSGNEEVFYRGKGEYLRLRYGKNVLRMELIIHGVPVQD